MGGKDKQEIPVMTREEKGTERKKKKVTLQQAPVKPMWRKKLQGGRRLKCVLGSGAVRTVILEDAIPGMKILSGERECTPKSRTDAITGRWGSEWKSISDY